MKQVGSKRNLTSNTFSWSDGSSINPLFWASGAPDNASGQQNCLRMKNGLNDLECWSTLPTFICQ